LKTGEASKILVYPNGTKWGGGRCRPLLFCSGNPAEK